MDGTTVFISWIVFSSIVGYLGSTRKIGAVGAFAVSIVLSPIIGFLFVVFSKPVENQVKVQAASSVSDEIGKLNMLYKDGALTKEEFETEKAKILNRQQ